jgi:hypothetical protein
MTLESNTENNQRKSDNLMNIVAVVYGVAITIAFSMSPDAILHPTSAAEIIPSVALLAAVLLTAFSFYSYALAIGGDKPYDVDWTPDSKKWFGLIRFTVDLVLAGLYVHLLLAAVNIETGPNAKPKLAGFVFAFVFVFAGAVMVRAVRRKQISIVAVIATIVSLGICLWIRSRTATRGTDLTVDVILLVGTLLYCWLYQFFAYKNRENARTATLRLVIYRPAPAADKEKFAQLLAQKLDARRCRKAGATLIQAWSLDQDEHGLQGAALLLDVRDQTAADRLASLPVDESELITIKIIPLQKLASASDLLTPPDITR